MLKCTLQCLRLMRRRSGRLDEVLGRLDVQDLMRPQGPHSGVNALIGSWPGDETDDEIFAQLEEMS